MATSSVRQTTSDTCVITCPRCSQSTAIPKEQLQLSKKTQHVRCVCGCMLRLVRLDQRRFPRQPVKLIGTLHHLTNQSCVATVTIVDLSVGGVRFTTDRTSLQVGKRYRIQFKLDDGLQTEIRADIVIRILHTDKTYGAEFLNSDCHADLDFYLAPWGMKH